MKRIFCLLVPVFVAAFHSHPVNGQAFGGIVAVGAEEVFVSEGRNQAWPGVVYVYRLDEGGTWREVQQLQAPDADGTADGFGRALAVEGGLLVVGAEQKAGGAGAVYVFERMPDGRWVGDARLTAADTAEGQRFGAVVALDGEVLLAGAPGREEDRGGVYVYTRDADGGWTPPSVLVADEVAAGDGFGSTLAVGGGHLLVGAPAQGESMGAVYAYRFEAGAWQAAGSLAVAGLEAGSMFGSALALGHGGALVGAQGHQGTGAVFAFRPAEDGTWQSDATLVPFDGDRGRFGASLAFDGAEAWIGAPRAAGFRGALYRFHYDADAGFWTGATKEADMDLTRGAGYASALAVGKARAVVGVSGADFGAGVAHILTPENEAWAVRATVFNEMRNYPAVTGGKVACDQGRAAAFDCKEVDMVAFLPVEQMGGGRGVRTNDLWGWTDPETGREYALVGLSNGTSFVDVTEATMPRYLGFLPMTEGARGSVWRDIKVYKDHAFIVSDGAGPHGVQVFDLRQLRHLEAPVTFRETAHYDGINSAHNIVINEETGYAYVVGSSMGGETCGGGLHMLNIQDPQHPVFAGCFADPATGRRGTGYSHDAQCVTYTGPDVAHRGSEICFGANETALSIADVTDKDHPVALSRATYPKVAYTHQGWLTEDQRYFYMNDEGDEPRGLVEGTRTLVWDVQDLEDPQLIYEYIAETRSTDHNLYVKGNLMYQSNYDAGFRILDISNPERPVEVGFFDTVPYEGGGGSWSNYPYFKSGVVIVTSSREGLFLLKKRDVDL